MEEEGGGAVGDALGAEGVEEGEVVDSAVDLGEEVGAPSSAFAVLGELPGGFHYPLRNAALAGVGEDAGVVEGHLLAVVFCEAGFVVEGIDLADSALHEEEDDAPGSGEKMRGFGSEGVLRFGLGSFGGEAGEGEVAESAGGAFQECATADGVGHGEGSIFRGGLCVD